ncbi:hypothetical protein J4E85_009486 [Alternaria conjuncta]|uniref:uncharacterized protein n=1 Tax=Alternaria conjuncta TaxID=181017 RepID=UPI00221EFC73|nr:uncharacterized protein J4E85_009486 [Alternaria conjuncta]KAI4919228.1 hypothetical protein J4E85_009486 [Alternaria conjuncta]
MSSPPAFEDTREERLDRDPPNHEFVASEAGRPPCVSLFSSWQNDNQYLHTVEASQALVEDARAVWNGDADHLLGNNEVPADVNGIHSFDQDFVNAIAPNALDISVAPQTDGGNTIPHVSLPQPRTQVSVAPVIPSIIPSVNNQVQHANATASRQCPYGCPNTFGRPGEYRRHMKKHNGPFFPCTRPHCGRMFYRQDKLNDHLNKGH